MKTKCEFSRCKYGSFMGIGHPCRRGCKNPVVVEEKTNEVITPEELLKENEIHRQFNKKLQLFFNEVVQKSLEEWEKLLSENDFLLAKKKKYFYDYIKTSGTSSISRIDPKEFHESFMSDFLPKDKRFVYSKMYGFIEIEKNMPDSPFGRKSEDNINLYIDSKNILVYSRDYKLLDGFNSVIRSFSQSISYSVKSDEVIEVYLGRKDIFSSFGVSGIIEYGILKN